MMTWKETREAIESALEGTQVSDEALEIVRRATAPTPKEAAENDKLSATFIHIEGEISCTS
jgi:hypothetical protein